MQTSTKQHGVLITGDNQFGKMLSPDDVIFLQQILTNFGYHVDTDWTEKGRISFTKAQDQPDLPTTFLTEHLENTTSNLLKLVQLYRDIDEIEQRADHKAIVTVGLLDDTSHDINSYTFKLIPGLKPHDLEDALRRNEPLFNKIADID